MSDSSIPMREPLRSEVLARLQGEMEFVERGTYLQRGRCPSCGKREMFTSIDGPWRLQCGRLNKCGATYHIKEIAPDLFDTWTNRYGRAAMERAKTQGLPVDRAIEASATPVADAYLEIGRGFDLNKIRGWYSQESYYDETLDAGSSTVRFPLPNGFWERLVDDPHRFDRKARAVGPYKGLWWQPPGLNLWECEEIWIVEGIFDAIALLHAGISAVSSISCSNYPDSALGDLAAKCFEAGLRRPRLVWAYDGDRAGSDAIKKSAKKARSDTWTCSAAIVPATGTAKRRDWNDIFQREELSPEDLDEYRYHGALLTAGNARVKAEMIFERTNRRGFWLEFRNNVYWYKMDEAIMGKTMEALGYEDPKAKPNKEDIREVMRRAGSLEKIANFHPRALYYMANALTDEAWYYWRVDFPSDKPAVKNTVTGAQLSGAAEFKKRMLHIAPGAIWTGSSQQLDSLLQDNISDIKRIETVDFVGYSRDHDAWLWGDVAVQHGKLLQLTSEDYFALHRVNVKSLTRTPAVKVNSDESAFATAWARLVHEAYGARGVICLAYWLGALFAEQIRARHENFPYLEISGEASSGKTTLIEFLWLLYGRKDTEGFNPTTSTAAFRARTIAQVSNMPVVMIEADQEPPAGSALKQSQFNWDIYKPMYNGHGPRGRGMRTQGNETYDPPFRGALVISQNAKVDASEPIMQRIVQTVFTCDGFSPATERAYQALADTPMEDVSGFVVKAAKLAKKLLPLFDKKFEEYRVELSGSPSIHVPRIARTHAMVAAMVDCLGPEGMGLLPANIVREAVIDLYALAEERQRTINADHPVVQEFWEAVDYAEGIESAKGELNHYGGDEKIAINLKHFESVCAELNIRAPASPELKRYLKGSKTKPFLSSNHPVRSRIFTGRTMRCWTFERKKALK